MPLVREFRRRTAASTNATPRKSGFETGGDRKYRCFWQTADFKSADDSVGMFAYQFAKALNRPGIPQGFVSMSSGQGKDAMASPLSWTSCAWIKDVANPAFRARLDALLLQDPNSEVSKKAITEYLKAVKAEVAKVPFLYAQPSAKLVPGITPPKIENAKAAEFDQWPKSLREIAVQLGTAEKAQSNEPCYPDGWPGTKAKGYQNQGHLGDWHWLCTARTCGS